MYTSDQAQKRWWQKLESIRSKPNFGAERSAILDRLTAAEGWNAICTPNTWAKSASRWRG